MPSHSTRDIYRGSDDTLRSRAASAEIASGATTRTALWHGLNLMWLVTAYTATVLGATLDHSWPTTQSLLGPSIVLSLSGAWGFFVAGKKVVNASSIASFGVLIFGGFAGIYTGLDLNSLRAMSIVPEILAALSFLFFFQLLIIHRALRKPSSELVSDPDLNRSRNWKGRAFFALAIFGLSLLGAAASLGTVVAPMAILGIWMAADSFFSSRQAVPVILGGLVLLAMCWCYWTFIFHGFGRLIIAVIACGIASIATLHFRSSLIKVALLCGAAAALPMLVTARLEFLEESRGTTPAESEGIGSVVGPLVSFGRLIDASLNSMFSPAWGKTYFDAVTLWIPREIWPSKPRGFGADMVFITQPHLAASTTFSDAAIFGGELVWNFGILGTAIAIPIIVYLLSRLDKLYRGIHILDDGWNAFFLRLMIIAASASVLNFVWAGSNLYVGRLQVLFFVLVVLFLASRKSPGASTAYRQARWTSGLPLSRP